MSAPTPLATLRATNCYDLTVLSTQLIAALGPRTSYIISAQQPASSQSLTDVMIPKEATSYALWAPMSSTHAASTCVFYAPESGAGAQMELRLLRANQPESQAVPVALADVSHSRTAAVAPESESVRALSVFFQTILAVESEANIRLYGLDENALLEATTAPASAPSAVTLPHLGTFALPVAVSDRGSHPRALLSANSTAPIASGSQEVFIGCVDETRHVLHAQLVSVTTASASAVRFTDPRKGIALPPALHHPVVSWSVNWFTQELVLLCRSAEADARDEATHEGGDTTHCASLSLRRADVAAGNQLTRWVLQPSFVNAATRPWLALTSDLYCVGDSAVYVVDKTTGPTVVLRNVASPALMETALPNSSTTARVRCAASITQGLLYVLAGRQVYALSTTASVAAPSASASSRSAAPTLGSSTPVSTAASQLRQRLTQSTQSQTSEQPSTAQARSAAATDAASVLAAIRTKNSHTKVPTTVVRDVHFARHGHHAVLESPAFQKLAPTEQVQTALRYVAAAESIHPYTVLVSLALVPCEANQQDDDDGARLALAVLFSRKGTLRDGGLQRHPDLASAAARLIKAEDYPQRAMTHKRFLAALCRTATTALALGSLGAAALLHTVADAVMVQLYGCHHAYESQPLPRINRRVDDKMPTEEVAELEAGIAESIALMKHYSQWALTDAATALGTVSAHVGEAREGRKEATLRDAHAHPITTSRHVDIKSLRLTRGQNSSAASAAPQ